MIPIELRFHKNEKYFLNIRKSCYSTSLYIYHGVEYKSVNYKLYYDTNGAIGCGYCCFPKSERLGFHPNDIERLKILLDKETNEPKFVFFSRHSIEDKWIPWEKCKKTDDNYLIIYVARGSHANYEKSGIWIRIFGLANDMCSNKGKKIRPILEEDKNYIHKPKEKTSHNFRIRFCLPCYL